MGKLVTMEEFIGYAHKEGIKITWSSLQVYYSPRMELMPKPVHMKGHKAHYDISNLLRLKLIKTLTKSLSLAKVKEILEHLSDSDVERLVSVVDEVGVDEVMLNMVSLASQPSRSDTKSIDDRIELGMKARTYHLRLWDFCMSGDTEGDATRMVECLFPQPRGPEEEVEHEQMKYGLWYEISVGTASKKDLLMHVLLDLYRDPYHYSFFREQKLKEKEETVKEYEKQ